MKTFGKILFGLLLLLVLGVVVGVILVKAFPDKAKAYLIPEVSNVRITGTTVRNGKMNMTVKADLSKKLIPFFLDSMSYQTVLYDDTVARGMKKFASEGDPGNSISLPMTVEYKNMTKKMKNNQGDSTLIGLAAQAFVDLPLLGTRRFDIYKEVPIRMIVFPEVKIDDIDFEKVGLNDTRMKVKVKITNPNNIDFHINGMKYSMTVKDYLTTKGTTTDDYHVKAFGTSDIEVFMKSDIDKPLKAAWKGIKGDKFPYQMVIDMNIKPSIENFDSMEFNTTVDGSVSVADLKKL